MDINPIILSIPIYFLLIGIELAVQFYSKKKIYRLNDAVANISCGITQQITNAFILVIMIAAYQFVYEYWAFTHIPVTWWSVVILVFAVDFCYYWAHRMSHEINLFWGGHVVHHQSEDYNFSVALRQGSFQGLWTFWFYIPLAFIGFDTVTFLLILALNTVYQFWIHTETIGKLPQPIEFFFNTPSHHRVHHGRNPKYIDKNHAGSLIIWDRMFCTFQKEEERPTYGITKPLNTWNPVWANLQHYVDMFDQFTKTPGLKNKANIFFNKPGWRPIEEGGILAVPEIQEPIKKYNNQPTLQLIMYTLVQFVITLIVTAFYLFNIDSLDLTTKVVFSLFIIWSVTQFGLLLDNNKKWLWFEYLRVFLISVFAVSLLSGYVYIFAAALYAAISIAWFFQSAREARTNNPIVKT